MKRISSVQERIRQARRRNVLLFLTGQIPVVARLRQGPWEIMVINKTNRFLGHVGLLGGKQYLIYNHNFSIKPVPSGLWMDWWEKEQDVTEEVYGDLAEEKRALVECRLQLKKYTKTQYWSLFAEFYMRRRYNKWRQTAKRADHSYWERELLGG